MKNSDVIRELKTVIAELQREEPYAMDTIASIRLVADRLKEDTKIIEYLKVRLEELYEKEPHATVTIEAYENVIGDLEGTL